MTKSVQPSPGAVKRARVAAIKKKLHEDREYFRVVSLWLFHCEYFYGGYFVRFVYDSGRVLRKNSGQQRYMTSEDYYTLHNLANELIKAIWRGKDEWNREQSMQRAQNSSKSATKKGRKKLKPKDPRQDDFGL